MSTNENVLCSNHAHHEPCRHENKITTKGSCRCVKCVYFAFDITCCSSRRCGGKVHLLHQNKKSVRHYFAMVFVVQQEKVRTTQTHSECLHASFLFTSKRKFSAPFEISEKPFRFILFFRCSHSCVNDAERKLSGSIFFFLGFSVWFGLVVLI
jgi:hypothetical protein